MVTGVTNDRHHVTECTELSHGAIMGSDNDGDHLTAVRGSPAVWARQTELDCIEMVMLGGHSPAARIPPAVAGAGARRAVLEAPWVHEAVSRRSREVTVQKGRHDDEVSAAQLTVSDNVTGTHGNRWPTPLPAHPADAAATAGLEALVERCQWRPQRLDPPSTRDGGEATVTLSEARPYDAETRPYAGVAGAAIEKRSAAASNAGAAALAEFSANMAAAGTTAPSRMRETCGAPQAGSDTISAHRRLNLEALQLEGEHDLNAGLPLTCSQQPTNDSPVATTAGGRDATSDAIGRAAQVMGEAGLQRWYENPGVCTSMEQLPEDGVWIPRGTRHIRTTATSNLHLTDRFIPASPRSLPAMLLSSRAGAARGDFSVPRGSTKSNNSSSSNSSCSSNSTSKQDGGRFGSLLGGAPTAVHAAVSNQSTHLNFPPGLRDPKNVGATVGAGSSVNADDGGGGAWGDGQLRAVHEARTGVDATTVAIASNLAHDRFVFASPPSRAQHPVPQCSLPVPYTIFTTMPHEDSSQPLTAARTATAHPTTPADGPIFIPPPPRSPRPSSAPPTASLAHCPPSPSGAAGVGSPTARSRLRFTSHSLPRANSGGGGSTSVLHSTHSSSGSDLASSHVHSLSPPLRASVHASLSSLPRASLDHHAVPALSPRLHARSLAAPRHLRIPLLSALPHRLAVPWHPPASAPAPPPAAAPPAVVADAALAKEVQEELQEATGQQAPPINTAVPLSPLSFLPAIPYAHASPRTASHQHLDRVGWSRRGRQQQQQAWRPLPPENFIPWETIYGPYTHTSTGLAAAVAAAIAAPCTTATTSAAAAAAPTGAGGAAVGGAAAVGFSGGAAAWVNASGEGHGLAGTVAATRVAAAYPFRYPSSTRPAANTPEPLHSHARHMGTQSQLVRAKSASDFSSPLLGSESPEAVAAVGGLPVTFSPGSWDGAAGRLHTHIHATTARMGGTLLFTGNASLLAKRRRMSPQQGAPAPPASSLQPARMFPRPQEHPNPLPLPPAIATNYLVESHPRQQQNSSALDSSIHAGSLPRQSPAQLSPHATAFPGRVFHRSCSTPVFSTAGNPSAAPPSPSLHPSPLCGTTAAAASLSGSVSGSDEKCVDLCATAAPFQGLLGAGSGGEMQQRGDVFVRSVESRGAHTEHRARATVGGLSMEMRRGGRAGGGGAVEDVVAQLEDDETRTQLSIHNESSSNGGSTMVAVGVPHVQAAMSMTINPEAAGVRISAGAQTDNTYGIFDPTDNTAN
ncbi:unnamed protein product [Closterium sp. NIES-64]|nr:unnamed protein product [Closterium sp. NIES-64]